MKKLRVACAFFFILAIGLAPIHTYSAVPKKNIKKKRNAPKKKKVDRQIIFTIPMSKIPGTAFYTIEVDTGTFGKSLMLVNTGAEQTVFVDWFVKMHSIPTTKIDHTPATGVVQKIERVKFEKLTFGDRTLRDLEFMVVNSPVLAKYKIAGIVSPQELFKKQDLMLDFESMRLSGGYFKPHPRHKLIEKVGLLPCSVEAPNRYLFSAKVNGSLGYFFLDSVGSHGSIESNFAQTLGPIESSNEIPHSPKIGVHVDNIKLEIGKIFSEAEFDIEPKLNSCPQANGRIGSDFLSQYTLYIDSHRSELRFYK